MGFHEVRFPASVSFGSLGGPERKTEIVTLANGFEERNTPWAHSRRHYNAGMGVRSVSDIQSIIAFFEARAGQLHGFRWKDWVDCSSCGADEAVGPLDQYIGTGDGTRTDFQLVKQYVSGPSSYSRRIAKPVAGSVRISLSGTEMAEGAGWSGDTGTGIVKFAVPPESGVTIRAGFEFDVPVRFDSGSINVSAASFGAGEIPDVPVVEIRI